MGQRRILTPSSVLPTYQSQAPDPRAIQSGSLKSVMELGGGPTEEDMNRQDYQRAKEEVYAQREQERAQADQEREQARQADAQKRQQNNVNEAQWRTAGVQSYTDANGVLQKVTDPFTGKDKTTDATGPTQWDNSGKAFQMERRDGAVQQKMLDENAPIVANPNDPKDTNLYRANKHAPWEPVDTNAGILSDDPNLRQASAAHLKELSQKELKQKMAELDTQIPSADNLPSKGELGKLLLRAESPDALLNPAEKQAVETYKKRQSLLEQKKQLIKNHVELSAQSLDEFTVNKRLELIPQNAKQIVGQQQENRLKNLNAVESQLLSERSAMDKEEIALVERQRTGLTAEEMPGHAAAMANLGVRRQGWQAKYESVAKAMEKDSADLSGPLAAPQPVLTPEELASTASVLADDPTKLGEFSADYTKGLASLEADKKAFQEAQKTKVPAATKAQQLLDARAERQQLEELQQREVALTTHAEILRTAATKQKETYRAKREETLAGPMTKGVAGQLSAIEDDAEAKISATTDPKEQEAIRQESQKAQQRVLDSVAEKEKALVQFRQAASEFAGGNNADSAGYEDRVKSFLKTSGRTRSEYEHALQDHAALTDWPDPTTINDGHLSDATKEKLGAGAATIAETGTRLLQGTAGKLLEKAFPSAFDAKEQQDVVRRTSTGDWAFNPFMGWEEDKVVAKMEEGVDGHKPTDAEKAALLKQVHQFQAETARPMLEALQDSSQFQDWFKLYEARNGPQNQGLKATQAEILREYLKSDDAKSGWNWIKTTTGDLWNQVKNFGTGVGAAVGSALFGADGAYNPEMMRWDLDRQKAYTQAMELAGQKGVVNEGINQLASVGIALGGGMIGRAMKGAAGAIGARAGVALGEMEASALGVAASAESAGLSWAAKQVAGVAGKSYNVLAASSAKWAQQIGMGGSMGAAGLQSYAQGFQSAYAAGREQGLDAEKAAAQAQLPAVLMGLTTAVVMQSTGAKGVESIFAKSGGPTFRDLMAKAGGAGGVLSALRSQEFRTMAKQMVQHGLGEAYSEVKEEGLDQWLQGVVEMGTFNPNKTITELAADAANAGVWGGVLGAAIPAASGAYQGAKNLRADFQQGAAETNGRLTALAPFNAENTAFHASAPSDVLLRGQQGHAAAGTHTEALASADAAVSQAQQALATATRPLDQVKAHEALAEAQNSRLAVIHRMAGTESAPTLVQLTAAQDELAQASPEDAGVAGAAMALHTNGASALNESELQTLGLARDGKGGFKSIADGPTGLPRVTFTAEGAPIFEQGFLNSVSTQFPAVAAILPSSEHAQRALLAPDGLKSTQDAGTEQAAKDAAKPVAKNANQAPAVLEFDVVVDGQKTPVRVTAPDEATAIAHVRAMGKGMVQDDAATPVPTQVSSDGVQGDPAPGLDQGQRGNSGNTPENVPHETKTNIDGLGMTVGQLADKISEAHYAQTGKPVPPQAQQRHLAMAQQLGAALSRWKTVFARISVITDSEGSGVRVKTRGRQLELDFTNLAYTAATTGENAGKWMELAIQEEVIHVVGLHLESQGLWNAGKMFKALPASLQELVKASYDSNKPSTLGHEFMRMVVQGKINAEVLTEHNAEPGLIDDIKEALKLLLDYVKNLVSNATKEGADEGTTRKITDISQRIERAMANLESGADLKNATQEATATPQTETKPASGPVEVRSNELPNQPSGGLGGATVPVPGVTEGGRAPRTSSEPTVSNDTVLADKLGIPPGAVGDQSKVSQNGKKVSVRFVAVERKDLKPSHNAQGEATKGYDQSLQPRDRSLPEYRKQAQNIGQNLSFDTAAFFPETDTPATTADLGAPVMDAKKQVVIGNGRSIGIDYAYANGEPSAARYKADFAKNASAFGIDRATVEGMNEPVLVRVIDEAISPADLVKFSQESNKGAAMASNAVEVAAEDATRIDPELLAMLDPNYDLDSKQNEDFRKAYIQRVILGRAKNAKSADGSNEANVTPAELAGRIRRGIFASAFGLEGEGRAALDRMAGDTDDSAKKITKGLLAVAGPYAWMRGQIAAGALHPMDIAKEIGAAAQSLAVALRDRGKASAKAVYAGLEEQQEMPGFSSDLQGLVQSLLLRERSSAHRIAHAFSNYVEAVQNLGNPGQLEMFEAPEIPTTAELFERATSSERLDADEQGHVLSAQALGGKTRFESEEYPFLGLPSEDWRSSAHPEANIINPVDPDASPDEKVEQLMALSRENKSIVDAILDEIRGTIGLNGKSSFKDPDRIQAKSSRPAIRAEKPWHDVEHIRDGLRFKVSMTHFKEAPKIMKILLAHGIKIVKLDTKKMTHPKEWGWRFVAWDLRMPNGQLVEFYAPLPELDDKSVKGPNHHLFENWRNVKEQDMTPALIEARNADIAESRSRYDEAYEKAIKRMGYSSTQSAETAWSNVVAFLESLMGEKRSGNSAALNVPAGTGRQILSKDSIMPSNLGSGTLTKTTPSSSSNTLSGDFITQNATPESLKNQVESALRNKRKAPIVFQDSLGIPRNEMPQIHSRQRGALANFLQARGINWSKEEVLPTTLKPTQAEFFPHKVEKARSYGLGSRAILVSSDDYILDGHHQLVAAQVDNPQEPMTIVRLNAPIKQLLSDVREMPSIKTSEGKDPPATKSPGGRVKMPDGAVLSGPEMITLDAQAFHGTPHKVGKFDLNKIGTGEGVQAFGWGLYFAENKAVAEGYRTRLAGAQWLDKNGKLYTDWEISDMVFTQARLDGHSVAKADGLRSGWKTYVKYGGQPSDMGFASVRKVIDRHGITLKQQGNLYTVDLLPADDEFLDWDKPLSEQSEKVKAAFPASWLGPYADKKGSELYGLVSVKPWNFDNGYIPNGSTTDRGSERASKWLNAKGISGIRYLDGVSRKTGNGTHDYVIFDDKLVKILEENGHPVEENDTALNAQRLGGGQLDLFADFVNTLPVHERTPASVAKRVKTELPKAVAEDLFAWSQNAPTVQDERNDLQSGKRSPGNRKPDGRPDKKSGGSKPVWEVAGEDDLFAFASRLGAGDSGQSDGVGERNDGGGLGIRGDAGNGQSERGATGESGDPSAGGDRGGRAPGTDGPPANGGQQLRELIPTPENEADRNARIDPGQNLVPKGQGAKIAANFKVIELLRQLTAEGRNPTTEEKAQLLTYSGWGHSKAAFDDAKAKGYENVSGGYYDTEWAKGKDDFKRRHNTRYIDKASGKPQPSIYDLYSWNDKWGDTHRALHEKLSDKEYNAAKRSVLNAHYTTPAIIDAQWRMLEKLGFRGGKALEPGAGIGHYIGTQPKNLADRTIWSAVELDQVTAQILSLLYPQARVNSVSSSPGRDVVGQGFEEALIADNSQDVVISNVPFHETGPWQSEKEFKRKLNLHNYFFARALQKVKPGGLIVFITSSSTMENNADQRRFLASRGELISAVRLPNNAFAENAGTQVTTDIIILRKPDGRKVPSQAWAGTRVVGRDKVNLKRGDVTPIQYLKGFDMEGTWTNPALESARQRWNDLRVAGLQDSDKSRTKANTEATAKAWKAYVDAFTTAEADSINGKLEAELPIRVNEYFAANPQNAFGRHSLAGSMYKADEYALQEDLAGGTLEERFARVIAELPENIMGQTADIKLSTVRDIERTDKPFSFVERDGKFWQVQGSNLVPLDWSNAEQLSFKSWKKVKDAVRNLIAAELDPKTEAGELSDLRKALNAAYDKHIGFFGPISKTGQGQRHGHLNEDPDFPLTVALETPEQFTNRKGKSETRYIKADIFRTRMNKPLTPPETAETASDALLSSLVWMGYPHVPYMATLLKRSEASVREEILESELVFDDPVSGNLVIRDSYLSGFVQGKLDEAKAAAAEDPAYRKNVAALELALPERKGIAQIGASMNSPWLPPEVLAGFMEHLGIVNAKAEYSAAANNWLVEGHGGSDEFSTSDVPTLELIEHALAMTVPRVSNMEGIGKDRKMVFDPAATQLAKSKLDKLKMEFQRWAKTSDAQVNGQSVQEVIVDAFNLKANGIKPPAFKGEHITLPGASDEVYRTGIRRSAIARMIDQGGGMIAHGVGFGKTYTLIALAMELKRLGKANRPMIIVENATLTQFAASFRVAYPNANVLVADEKSFSGKHRRQFVSRIATGDHDCILMAHSQFNLIGNHPDVVNSYIDEQVAELEAARALTDSADKRAVAALEKAKIGLENARKKTLDSLAKRQDAGLHWEDLGIDTLLVDEAHRYKNAPVITRMQGMKNLPTGEPSQRAVGMVIKAKGIQGRMAGRGVFFATGTPVSNSMAEAFVMLRYTSPNLLENQGIENFDRFVASFGVADTKAEANWKGAISMETRLSKFVNGNALINLIRSSWDVQMDPEVAGIKRPEIKGGAAQQVLIKPGEANQAYNDWVVNTIAQQWDDPQYWAAMGGKKQAFEDNPALSAIPIMTMQAGIAAALDIRLIDPNAADYPGSKVNTAVRKIVENYKSTSAYSGAQCVFADLRESFSIDHLLSFAGDPGLSEKGMEVPEQVPVVLDEDGNPLPAPKKPKKSKEFDLYQDIARKLVEAGIPRGEIGLIASSMSPEKRSEIFDKVNSGEIRVIIGSTDLMGVGVNMQERLHSMHHLMPPRDFKPASQEQRTGRILRQGNLHYDMALEAFVASAEKSTGKTFRKDKGGKMVPDMAAATAALDAEGLAKAESAAEQFHIEEYQYAMEKSIDSAIFSMMASKQRMVVQLLMGEVTDSFEDPSDAISMGMAEIAARAIGDPTLIRRVELEREIRELAMEFQGFQNDLMSARDGLRHTQYELSVIDRKAAEATEAANTVGKIGTDPDRETVWSFGGKTVDRNRPKDAKEAKGWKAPKLIEDLDSFLLAESIKLNKSDLAKLSRVPLEVDGVKFTVEIHQSLGDTRTVEEKYADAMAGKDSSVSAKGTVWAAGYSDSGSNFAGAQSLISKISNMARYYANAPAKIEADRKFYEKRLPSLQEKATRTFERADELAALYTEMDQVEARLSERAAPPPAPVETAVSKARKKGIELPPVTPVEERFMTPQVRDIINQSTVVDSALKLPESLDRKVYEAVNKALESAGGRWDRSTKTHLFAEDPRAALGLPQDADEDTVLNSQSLGGGSTQQREAFDSYNNTRPNTPDTKRGNLERAFRKLAAIPNRTPAQEEAFRTVEAKMGQGFLLNPWEGLKEIPPGPGLVKGFTNNSPQGVLFAQSFGDLLRKSGADLADLDALYDAAAREKSGFRTIGNPDRSLGGGVNSPADPVIFGTDQLYDDQFTPQTFDEWRQKAVTLLEEDYDGTMNYLIRYGMASGGAGMKPWENMAAQMIVERESRLPMTPERIRRLQAMVWAYRLSGSDQARNLASRRDPFKTPEQRNREFLAKMIFTPPPALAKKIEQAETPQARERLMKVDEQRIEQIRRVFSKMGTSLDEVLSGGIRLGLVTHSITQGTLSGLEGKQRQAAELAQTANLNAKEIAQETGLKPAEVVAIADARRKKFKEELKRRRQLRNEDTLNAQALEAVIDFAETEGMTDAEFEAWANRKADEAGLFAGAELGKRKTVKRKPVKLFVPPKQAAAHSGEGKPLRDLGGPNRWQQLELPQRGKPLPPANQGTTEITGAGDLGEMSDPKANRIGEDRVPAAGAGRWIAGPANMPAGANQATRDDHFGKLWEDGPAEFSVRVGADMADAEDMVRLARIAQAATAGPLDMVKEAWINNILSGPATHVANITGNAVSGAWDFTVQRGMEALWNLAANDPKGATFGEMGHIMKAVSPGIAKGFRLMAKAWRTEEDFFHEEVLGGERKLFETGPAGELRRIAISGTKGRVIRIPGRALMAMDGFFKGLFGQMEAAAQAYRIAKSEKLTGEALQKRINTLVSTPNSRAWQLAVEKATALTFQEDLPELVQLLQRGIGLSKIGSFVIPFVRTPYNIFRTGIRKSPIGMANLVYHLGKHGLAKIKGDGSITTAAPAEMVRWLAEQTLAWAGMAILWGAAAGDDDDDKKHFLITGSPPRDKGLKALNDRAVGGGYQIKIGGMTMNYGRIEPIATVLGTMIDGIKAVKSGGSKGATAAAILDNLKGQVMNKTFLQGLAGIIDGIERPGKWDEKAKNSLMAALVPNLIRQPLRNADESVRDYGTADWWYPAWPDASLGGSPVVDPVTGQDKTKGGNMLSRMVQQPVAPRGELTQADRALLAFNRANPDKAWAPKVPDNEILYASKTATTPTVQVKLNANAYNMLQKRTALHAKQELAGQTFTADADGVKRIQKIYDHARDRAEAELRSRPIAQIGAVK